MKSLQLLIQSKDYVHGNYEMPASILKQCIETDIHPLIYLVNLSINKGIFLMS